MVGGRKGQEGVDKMRLVIGLPWYAGPDETTFPFYFSLMSYFGAMRERSLWYKQVGKEAFSDTVLPPLDETQGDDGRAELTLEEWEAISPLELVLCNYSRTSLVGKAREHIVETALGVDADYIFWWDSDMLFDYSAFVRLWRHQVPVVGGLAFTARHPIFPVIYRINEVEVPGNRGFESSEPVFDYPEDALITNEDVSGELAFGAAMMLTDVKVFREIPLPWFASTGCGEDWFFCHRCMEYGIPRYLDTSIKSQHKEHSPRWADEETYWQSREMMHDAYELNFPGLVKPYSNGKSMETA